ncbi:MAG: cellobiose phosphorylase [Candidatus Omnitrophica bacterium]|nr:cellobiose phosphorylase [Candidatus Omnitrophota bacterium]MBD3269180.1 cellobiose phosphorylase [Candidatus Omnitrophota bacterium]
MLKHDSCFRLKRLSSQTLPVINYTSGNMIYEFIDKKGTFRVKNPQLYNLYLPLTDKEGKLLSSISPNLGGDIKSDNNHFLTIPATIEDVKNNLLCRREFFLNVRGSLSSKKSKTVRLSLPYDDTVEIGFLYQKVIKRVKPLLVEITNFVPYDTPVEVMRVRIKNCSGGPVYITPTSFMPLYGRRENNLRDHRHVSSLLNRIFLDKYALYLKPTLIFDEKGHKKNKDIYFALGFEESCKPCVGQFPTLEYFFGKGDILYPEAMTSKIRPVRKKSRDFEGKEVCASFRFKDKKLKKEEAVNYFLIYGIEKNRESTNKFTLQKALNRLNSPKKIEEKLVQTQTYWLDYLSNLSFDFKDKNFNNWLEWVKIQPRLRKLFGCSFLPHFDYGKGGRGWRDLWQDALSLLLQEPEEARTIIINSLRGVRIDGSNATIITPDNDFISDRNKISRVWMDHGIWPFLTLQSYMERTADLSILEIPLTYFRDHLIKRSGQKDTSFSQNDYLLRDIKKRVYKGSILEHILIQHLTSFFNVNEHNIIKLENADWNDGLDMASAKGGSVAFSFMYASNLKSLCLYLQRLKPKKTKVYLLKELKILLDRINKPLNYNNPGEKNATLEEYFEKTIRLSGEKIPFSIDKIITDLRYKHEHLAQRLQKEWLKEGFFNGYYDNKGRRAEGIKANRVRLMLASQVFPIMSGFAEKYQIEKIWKTAEKYLKDKDLGGFRLNTDFGSLYMELGRAFGFSYGDKENGAFFNHMIIMFANSLLKRGFVKEGLTALSSVYKMANSARAEIYPMIPEYFNNRGKGLYLYLTGSASWYVYTLIREVLGIKYSHGDILLQPALNSSIFFSKSIDFRFQYEDKNINISFMIGNKAGFDKYRIKKAVMEGKILPSKPERCLIKKNVLKKCKSKEISLKVFLGYPLQPDKKKF